MAIAIGALAALVAAALLKLIALFTNLFFFQRWGTAFLSPASNALGPLEILVPVAGALIIGSLARYGSERIRGHGIPEALEAILIHGSRVQPRVAILKPISAAISIGSGGPFGAEGPIIMTGGALGSIVGQMFHLTSAERKTLLVAGAAAGMSATFAAPIASVLLAVELLLFELKPRSLIPVSLASATAMAMRHVLLGPGPIFPVPIHAPFTGSKGLAGCVLLGLLSGLVAALMTLSVYAAEDLFKRLPIHWMWWPAIGGLAVGLGGFICPGALGVGYETIDGLLRGALPVKEILLLIVVKWIIWSIALGSGTSGGVLAPLLMIGSALGGLMALVLPGEGAGCWALISMGAILGGMMRSPLTGVIFAAELTGDHGMLLPLLVASSVAHGLSVLTMKRSILTEKVARRGYHMTREYCVDPLEVAFVRDVMDTCVIGIPAAFSTDEAATFLNQEDGGRNRLYPIVEPDGQLAGVVTRWRLKHWVKETGTSEGVHTVRQIATLTPVTAHPDEPLHIAVHRMSETGRTRLPVVSRDNHRRVLGMISLAHTLEAKRRHVEEEWRRERVLPISVLLPAFLRPPWLRRATSERNGKPMPANDGDGS
ncbi:MAG: chloride channel protein [Polyangia bacterium]|jgi:H+/Cl- antiporter ClcA